MKFYVGVTDGDWFTFLAASTALDEVNFWQPSAGRQFRILQPGEPFLFKLHSPRNYIVGGGFFVKYTSLPVSFAWRAFGEKNGAQTEQEMRTRITRYRRVPPSPTEDYEIGCILLRQPFFFPQGSWIPTLEWSPNIVQGRSYDTTHAIGQRLWEQVQQRLSLTESATLLTDTSGTDEGRYGTPQLVAQRLGQGAFRVLVADAYKRRCALTGSPVLHVLDAAHIRPYAEGGPHSVANGILLRQDIHTLFDRGYITVTPDYRVEVSQRIKVEFENGREYYSTQGKPLAVPDAIQMRPAIEHLRWHNEHVYR